MPAFFIAANIFIFLRFLSQMLGIFYSGFFKLSIPFSKIIYYLFLYNIRL